MAASLHLFCSGTLATGAQTSEAPKMLPPTNRVANSSVVRKGEAIFRESWLKVSTNRMPKSPFGHSYAVPEKNHFGFFAVDRADGISAFELQERLAGRRVPVRYDPDCPNHSFVVDHEILGTPIHQSPDWIPDSLHRQLLNVCAPTPKSSADRAHESIRAVTPRTRLYGNRGETIILRRG